jgi:hypothetical protein
MNKIKTMAIVLKVEEGTTESDLQKAISSDEMMEACFFIGDTGAFEGLYEIYTSELEMDDFVEKMKTRC